ncbi:MAG TPA: PhnD/SsuA/transferrin family substrate-binding protein [Stellaceae bacterium]|nr:PhnD/SsuA/transferrin family substrate-binding protein [Stellaceae bacterium]
MLANARMYAVTPAVAQLWRRLLAGIAARAGAAIDIVEHAPPAPIAALWSRPDLAAVLMCGLPFSRALPPPALVAAPLPAPAEYGGKPQYWSAFVARAESGYQRLEDSFGGRIAFTTPDSQSGYAAALHHLMPAGGGRPLYREIIAPTVTPLGALSAVREGRADAAPIDGFALDLLRRHAPELTAGLRILARTEPTAIPPFIASAPPLPALRQAFLGAQDDPALRPLLEALLLQRFAPASADDYAPLRERFETALAFWRRHPLAAVTHPAFAL